MAKLLGISGSLRSQSLNTYLLNAAAKLVPEGTSLEVVTLHGIPLYDGDLEQRDGSPQAVERLKQKIRAADGIILSTPEYNNGIPGVVKNGIDWLSRPSDQISTLFGGRPFAVIGASPSGFGTLLAQTAWLPILKALGVKFWTGSSLQVSRAHTLFDDQGDLTDEAIQKRLAGFLKNFSEFTHQQ